MKNVKVIRRIDYLGRIVIPNDIRKTLNIKQDDQIEFELLENEILLKKYSKIKDTKKITQTVFKSLINIISSPILILDLENVLFASDGASEYEGKKITTEVFNLIKEKKNISINKLNKTKPKKLFIGDNLEFKGQTIVPIISQDNEGVGAIILLDKEGGLSNAEDIKLLKMASQIISMEAE